MQRSPLAAESADLAPHAMCRRAFACTYQQLRQKTASTQTNKSQFLDIKSYNVIGAFPGRANMVAASDLRADALSVAKEAEEMDGKKKKKKSKNISKKKKTKNQASEAVHQLSSEELTRLIADAVAKVLYYPELVGKGLDEDLSSTTAKEMQSTPQILDAAHASLMALRRPEKSYFGAPPLSTVTSYAPSSGIGPRAQAYWRATPRVSGPAPATKTSLSSFSEYQSFYPGQEPSSLLSDLRSSLASISDSTSITNSTRGIRNHETPRHARVRR